jgi:hypothetical protein
MNLTMPYPDQGTEVPAGAAAGRRRAVLALARVEAVRLLRHPITLVAVPLLLGIWVSGWVTNEANHYPVLQDADRDTELGMMLLLGGAALIAGNLAVLRAHRNGTTALSEVLVLPVPLRTAAHLLALLPLALLAAVLTAGRVAILAVVAPAAGRPNPFELATGSVIVLLLGALGVLLGRLARSPVVAPLALLGLLALLVVVPLVHGGGAAQSFEPVVPSDPTFMMPPPVVLMARPAGAHLAYLVGLAVLVCVGALVRGGARTVRLTIVAVAAVAVAVAGGIAQTAPPSPPVVQARAVAMTHPSRQQTCRVLGHVTYCAFPDFTPWIPAWDSEVRGVLRRVPAAVAQQPLAVRQRIIVLRGDVLPDPTDAWRADDIAAGTPDSVAVDTRWGDSRSAATLAGLVAYRLVGGAQPEVCGARGVLVGWLAGQASAQSNTGLHLIVADQAGRPDSGVTLGEPGTAAAVQLPSRGVTLALALLGRPAGEVGTRVRQSWDELTAADTTIERAAEIFGLPAPPASGATASDDAGRCP